MKKIAKISLVAAVAVAGLTTANAQPLEEAIKNVDVSGSVVYRYNDYNGQEKASVGQTSKDDYTSNNYKVGLNLSSKVNDDVKFNSRFVVAGPDLGWASVLDTGKGLNTSTEADTNPGVSLSQANFAYTGIKNTTVAVGKQGLATPWTKAEQVDGNEQTGTGALAMTVVGPVTFAGAFFNQTNLNTSTDVSNNGTSLLGALDGTASVAAVAAIAAIGPVTADAWYLDMDQTFSTYTVGAKASTKVSGIDLTADARYASLNLDNDETKNDMAKLLLTAKAGIIDGKVAYAMTNKEGGLTALDNDATTTLLGWNLTSNGKADADYLQLAAGVDILSNLNLSANYGNVKYKKTSVSTSDDMKDQEIYAQLLYKMSKNLTSYIRYGELTKEDTTTNVKTTDGTVGRLQVAYTF